MATTAAATEITECPGCNCEPEVTSYFREVATGKRIGYRCACGVVVHYGCVVFYDPIGP